MGIRTIFIALLLLVFSAFGVPNAYAGDAATIAFEGGQVVYIPTGYQEVLSAIQRKSKKEPYFVKLTISGGTFLLNISEVILVCRDKCDGVVFKDPRESKR